jgi:hypothetical protein
MEASMIVMKLSEISGVIKRTLKLATVGNKTVVLGRLLLEIWEYPELMGM